MRGLPVNALRITLATLAALNGWAQSPQPPSAAASPEKLPIQEIKPGVFQLGKTQINQADRSVTFPAVLNMNEAVLEYFLVTENGKTHESLLRTDVAPTDINVALLLLGAKGAQDRPFPDVNAEEITGTKVDIEVGWQIEGQPKTVPAEMLVYNRQAASTMTRGPWIYNGSVVFEGAFLAQQSGSIISLILDPVAVINNPRRGAENDELWEVNTNGLPELNSPVRVTIRLHTPPPNTKTNANSTPGPAPEQP